MGCGVLDVADIVFVYGQLVAIMNPFTAVNNFLTITEDMNRVEARSVLRKAIIVVLFLGLVFLLAGKAILEFYHLSLSALRFGGGILLLYIAVDMLSGAPKSRSVDSGELAVVPLATPMIIGPGTMTLLIHLGTVKALPVSITAFLLATLTITVALYASNGIRRVLGSSGVKAMARFMSLIIAAVAAEMLHAAVADWATSILKG